MAFQSAFYHLRCEIFIIQITFLQVTIRMHILCTVFLRSKFYARLAFSKFKLLYTYVAMCYTLFYKNTQVFAEPQYSNKCLLLNLGLFLNYSEVPKVQACLKIQGLYPIVLMPSFINKAKMEQNNEYCMKNVNVSVKAALSNPDGT